MQRDFVTTLISLIALVFAALLPFGTNVPFTRRPQLTRYFVLVNVAVHVLTQIIDIQSGLPLTRAMKIIADGDASGLLIHQYIDAFGLTPEKLLKGDQPWRWIQIVTANFLHGSWLHLIMNLWFFVLFSANIEDAFGPKKYLLTMAAAAIGSQLSVAFFAPAGTEAAKMPHIGFSGVVYAVMAAYLICFPRSRVRVMLIYNLWFWMIGLFGAGFLAIILWFFVGSLAQLIWFLAFIGLFSAMQPGHVVFGVPAFVFLGFRVLYDGLTLEHQISSSGVSVWSHAGGFMVGTTAALLVYGTKGLKETWETEQEKPELSREEQAKQKTADLMESAKADETAARAVLGRFVFLRDSASACDLYGKVVMPAWPGLTLDYDLQVDLARMLDLRGLTELAIHAYDNLLWNYPNGPAVDQAYLAAAKLSQNLPDRLAIALQYLNRLESMDCLMRDKLESRRLRAEIEALGAGKGVDLTEARTAVFQGIDGDTQQSPGARPGQAWESRLPLSKPPSTSRASSRIQQLEPAADKPRAPAQFSIGRKPLPLISREPLRREDAESAPRPTTGTPRRQVVHRTVQSVSREEPPPLEVSQTLSGQAGPGPGATIPERRLTLPVDGEKIEARGPINLDAAAETNHQAVADESRDLFQMPFISEDRAAGAATTGVDGLEEDAFDQHGRDASADGGTPTYCVILQEGASFNPASLLEVLREAVGDDAKARQILAVGKGCLFGSLDDVEARRLLDKLAGAGIPASAVCEQHPALACEPCEATSCVLSGNALEVTGPTFRVHVPASDLLLVTCSAMKLSSASKSYRTVLELVAQPRLCRLQLWDRTLALRKCLVENKPVGRETAFQEILGALCARAPATALSSAARRAAQDFAHLPRFDSYQEYENYVRFCILSRMGTRLTRSHTD